MNVDGWVTIGFRGEDKQLKQDVNSLKNDLKKSEKDIKDMLEAKVKLTMEVGNEEQIKARIKEIKDLMKSGEEFEIEGFEGTGSEYIEYLKEGLSTHQFINNEIDKEKQNYLELENQIKKTEMANEFKKTGKEIGGNIKSIAKLALGIIGIRSAYSMVTRAVSTLSRYNEDMANEIEYMQWALAKALEPVVEKILQLGMQLLSVLNSITTILFGYPIFGEATAEAFNSARKQAGALKKTLAGFDEMTTVSSGGKSDYTGPSIPEMEVDSKTSSLVWDLVAGVTALAGGILACKLGLEGIQGLGIVIAVFGFIEMIYTLIEAVDEVRETGTICGDTLKEILTWLGVALIGIGILVASWPVALVGLGVIILGIVAKYWDKIKTFIINALDWLHNKTLGISDFFLAPIKIIISLFDGLFKALKDIFTGIVMMIDGDFAGGFRKIFNGLVNFLIGILNACIDLVNGFIAPFTGLIDGVGKILGKNWNTSNVVRIPHVNYLANGGILNNPGKGVPVGNSTIAGEAGAEAYLPLTNPKAMSMIGEAIGRYITINATIENSMNGRVISRELARVNQSNDFARNGGYR